MYTPFKSNIIDYMGHMRISGTKPSSVILKQTKSIKKLKRDSPKVPKDALAKKGWCPKPTILLNFQLGKIEQISSDR